ncbi:DNA polymerase III subunit beta [soil metagenome]
MKIQILQEDLIKILTTSIRFTNTRSTLPILSNFLLKVDKTKLVIAATNLEMSISSQIGGKVDEEGSITIPAKTFLELIQNLSLGQITLTQEKDQLKVSANNFEGEIPIIPANDFPTIPDSLDSKNSFSIPTKDFIKALNNILFSTSLEESRPVLTGVLFIFKDNILNLVSSDGFRLSRLDIKLENKISLPNLIIPRTSLLEIIKIAKDEEFISFEVKSTENQLIVKIGDTYLASRLIEGNFPDFEKIIPVSTTTKVNVDKNDLSRGVKLASVFAKDGSGVIKFVISENAIEVLGESAKAGNQKSKMEAKVDGPNLEISFNYKFVEDFLNNLTSDDLEIQMTDSVSAAIFVDPKNKGFLHLIMPVRVQN